MHILTFVHTDPRNHERFPKWINSLDYGSRPFCREIRLYDIAVQEVHKDKLLADLKHHGISAASSPAKSKVTKMIKLAQFFLKFFKLKPVSMEGIEKTPEKWHKPFPYAHGCTNTIYLSPVGSFPDIKGKKGKGKEDHDEI